MKYGHPPAPWWHLFDGGLAFYIATGGFQLVCVRLLGRWGNKLAFVSERGRSE